MTETQRPGGSRAPARRPGTGSARRRRHLRRKRDASDFFQVLSEERTRIAADVHDLIMQDLALALARARMSVDDPDARFAPEAVAAAERALDAARRLVENLALPSETDIAGAVEAAARTAAREVPVSFDATGVPHDARADPRTLWTLVHVARESVANAVKHGSPSAVTVVLRREEDWTLRVSDDGSGFRTGAAEPGFGLRSMRTQAEALGGRLFVRAHPGAGASVELSVP